MAATKKRRKLSMPAQLRAQVVAHCRSIARIFGAEFKADRDLKACVLHLERALLPPRPAAQSGDDARACVVSEVSPRISRRGPTETLGQSLSKSD
jgi:hypothetical protein